MLERYYPILVPSEVYRQLAETCEYGELASDTVLRAAVTHFTNDVPAGMREQIVSEFWWFGPHSDEEEEPQGRLKRWWHGLGKALATFVGHHKPKQTRDQAFLQTTDDRCRPSLVQQLAAEFARANRP